MIYLLGVTVYSWLQTAYILAVIPYKDYITGFLSRSPMHLPILGGPHTAHTGYSICPFQASPFQASPFQAIMVRGAPCLMQGCCMSHASCRVTHAGVSHASCRVPHGGVCLVVCCVVCVCECVCVCAGDLPCEPLWFRFVSPPGLVGLWPSPSGRTPLTPLLESLLPLQECLSPTCPDFPARNTSTTKLQNYLLRM